MKNFVPSIVFAFFILTGAHAQSCNCPVTTSLCPGLQVVTGNLNCTGISCTESGGRYTIIVDGAVPCGTSAGNIQIFANTTVDVASVIVGISGSANDVVALTMYALSGGAYTNIGGATKGSGSTGLFRIDNIIAQTITGTWTANKIEEMFASGNFQATINTVASGTYPGDIYSLRSGNGNITSDITAGGTISIIHATNGTIGSSSDYASITSNGRIESVVANAIYADINTGSGDLWYLRTSNGPFSGSLTTTNIFSASQVPGDPKGIDIRGVPGNLDANITCSGQIKEILGIDGTILSGRTITTATTGVTNLIILNQDANSGVTWPGSVKVGGSSGTTLSPTPYYDNAPSLLGGGAVGLAPFNVHYEGCTPAGTGDPTTTLGACQAHATVASDTTTVLLMHYRPLRFYDGTATLINTPPAGTEGFTVEKSEDGICTWTDVTDSFTTTITGNLTRTASITGPFNAECGVAWYYRIKPVRALSTGRVVPVCRNLDVSNVLIADYEYIVKVNAADCGGWGGN